MRLMNITQLISRTLQVDPFAALRAQRTQGAPQGMHFILSTEQMQTCKPSARRVSIVHSSKAPLASLDDLEGSNWHSTCRVFVTVSGLCTPTR